MKKLSFITFLLVISWNSGFSQRQAGPPKKPSTLSKEKGTLVANHIAFSPQELEVMLNNCGVVTNLKYIGDPVQYGKFVNDNSGSGMKKGLIIATGDVENANGPNESNSTTSVLDSGSDPDLQNISNGSSYVNDAGGFEFDLTANTELLSFWCVFASEEYPEFVCTSFNDLFAVFIDDNNTGYKNISTVPGTEIPIRINTVNPGNPYNGGITTSCDPASDDFDFSSYYVDNILGSQEVEYDGYTIPLLIQYPLEIGKTYHLKLVIGDVGDLSYDSGLLITSDAYQLGGLSNPFINFKQHFTGNTLYLQNVTKYADSYLWDFGDGTTSTEKNPAPHVYSNPGNYVVKLTASNNKLSGESEKMLNTQPNLELSDLSIEHKSCKNDGAISLSINSNLPQVYYKWSDQKDLSYSPTSQWITTIERNDLAEGTYSVEVFAGMESKIYGPFEIKDLDKEVDVDYVVKTSCKENAIGNIKLTFPNAAPQSLKWSHDSNLQSYSANNILPGLYTITVTNAIGCMGTKSIKIEQFPETMLTNLKVTQVDCKNSKGDFSFQLDNTFNKDMAKILTTDKKLVFDVLANLDYSKLLPPGDYLLKHTNAYGCDNYFDFTVPIIKSPSSKYLANAPDEEDNYSINLQTLNGVPPFSYAWSDGTTGNVKLNTKANLNFEVVVTDAIGCTEIIKIKAPIDSKTPTYKFFAYPSPGDQFVEIRNIDKIETTQQIMHYSLIDLSGKTVQSNDFDPLSSIRLNTTQLPNGLYYLQIAGNNFSETINIPILH